MLAKRKADDLSLEELEKLLRIKRRQSRLERFQQLSEEGHSSHEALVGAVKQPAGAAGQPLVPEGANEEAHRRPPARPRSRSRGRLLNSLLLGLEVVAVIGLVGVLIASYFNLRELNDEVSQAQQQLVRQQAAPTPTAAPPITLARLPGGHTPPTAPGGAIPDVPLHLQQWVQPGSAQAAGGAIEVTPPDISPPTRIVIPKIKVDAPIVHGVGWEDLKKGVGHLPGSANPGERGNLYLAAHNDIYGEIFRHLEELEVGDEYYIYAAEEQFRYVVKERRIIEPTEVEIMLPTTEPVATLQTCYPYLVDTHRLVVVSELAK